MSFLYILPVLVLVAVVFIARKGQQAMIQKVQNMSPEEGRKKINDYFANNFELQPGETLWAVWIGEEYQGEKSASSQVAGAALNQASKALIGVTTYVPLVRIAATSTRRILVAREYSQGGDRNHYKQIASFEPGTRVVDAATAYPNQLITPPLKNPLLGGQAPEFVQVISPSGERYEAWMTGGQSADSFVSSFTTAYEQIPTQ